MALIRINRHPSGRQLAVFGLTWLAFFALWGGSAWHRGRPAAAELIWAIAAAVPLFGWMRPSVLRRVYVGASYATFPIGFVVSHVVLALIYYLVLSPLGLILRLFGHNPLGRGFNPSASSYWQQREDAKPPESYFRQS
jgi:hypothetical protein